MRRLEIPAVLGSEPDKFKKGGSEAEAFPTHQLHVYYDAKNTVEYIEFWGIARVTFDGQEIQEANAVRHDDVLALSDDSEPGLLQCPYSVAVVDSREARHA